VTRAGAKQLAEFELGRTVIQQSGCLACHRLGVNGNLGVGADLTHIGSTLSSQEIEHAILHATPPMPSFDDLPPAKLAALVDFLSQLRR
jgi:quinol---cytochrome c reductase cytochrome c subunit, bacillus type